jgi:hypothetical protein
VLMRSLDRLAKTGIRELAGPASCVVCHLPVSTQTHTAMGFRMRCSVARVASLWPKEPFCLYSIQSPVPAPLRRLFGAELPIPVAGSTPQRLTDFLRDRLAAS